MPQTNQPTPAAGQFKYGTFQCMDSCMDCLLACFLGSIYNVIAVKATGQGIGCGILTCLFPCGLCCVRQKVREEKGIEGSAVNDFLCAMFCNCCTAIQLKREYEP